MIRSGVNFFGYKLIWLSGIWGWNHGIQISTPFLSMGYLLVTLYQVRKPWQFLTYVTGIALLGIGIESMVLNQFCYQWPAEISHTPAWLCAIWVAFPCMCYSSLKGVLNHPLKSALIGGVFGPLAYKGADSMGTVILINEGLGILSISWILVMLVIHLSLKRLSLASN